MRVTDGAESRRTKDKNANQTQNYLFYGSVREGGIILHRPSRGKQGPQSSVGI